MAQLMVAPGSESHGTCLSPERAEVAWPAASVFRRKTDAFSIGPDGWSVDDVLGHKPDLQLIRADHRAHEQVVGPVVTRLVGQPGHRARFLQHDFVSVEDLRDLDRNRLTALRRPRN